MKNNKNEILKEYIVNKYGGLTKFANKEKFSMQYLETVIDKKDIFHEIGIGIKVCEYLNIDAEKLFCENVIAVTENSEKDTADAYVGKSLDDIIKEKYAKLSEENQKKALDFTEYILANGE